MVMDMQAPVAIEAQLEVLRVEREGFTNAAARVRAGQTGDLYPTRDEYRDAQALLASLLRRDASPAYAKAA